MKLLRDLLSTSISLSLSVFSRILYDKTMKKINKTNMTPPLSITKIKQEIDKRNHKNLLIFINPIREVNTFINHITVISEKEKDRVNKELGTRKYELRLKDPKTTSDYCLLAYKEKKHIILTNNALSLAHEYGHYLNQEENKKHNSELKAKIKELSKSSAGFSNKKHPIIMIIQELLGFLGPIENIAGLLGAYIIRIPTLLDELCASIRAIEFLKEIGVSEEKLKLVKQFYRQAFETYLLTTSHTYGNRSLRGAVLRTAGDIILK